MAKHINITIAEEHFIFREGLQRIINTFTGFTVSSVAESVSALIAAFLEKNETPDICIIGFSTPEAQDHELLEQLKGG